MTIEYLYTPGPLEVRAAGQKATVAGYAAMFNSYSQNLGGFVEQVAPEAFTATIRTKKDSPTNDIKALWNHEDSTPLGRTNNGTLRLSTDGDGLAYELDINTKDPDGQRAVAKIEAGLVSQSSFGFKTLDDDWETTEQDFPLRTLTKVELFEVSPVTFPAYLDTTVAKRSQLFSLAEMSGIPLEDLIAASEANKLRECLLVRGADPSSASLLKIHRQRLELMARAR